MAQSPSMTAAGLTGDVIGRGFTDPVLAAQRCFRTVLAAMSEPGRVLEIGDDIEAPGVLAPAAARVLLTLADPETPVWLAPSLVAATAYVRFHCSAPVADDPGKAQFAVIEGTNAAPGLAAFPAGDERYPDRSATIIVQCAAMTGGTAVVLSGPGIRGEKRVAPSGLHQGFWAEAMDNHALAPLGVDLILAAGDAILCVPRSTRISLDEGGG